MILSSSRSSAEQALTRGIRLPPQYDLLLRRSVDLGFTMNSDVLTGALLRSLAAMKPAGRLLELGTGCGLGTAWLVDGMDRLATLTTIDTDERVQAVPRAIFASDPRVIFRLQDGGEFLAKWRESFDLIYADAWPGKFDQLTEALDLLAPGGVYVIDDLLPQPNWPSGHEAKVIALIEVVSTLPGFQWTPLVWSTGVGVLVKS